MEMYSDNGGMTNSDRIFSSLCARKVRKKLFARAKNHRLILCISLFKTMLTGCSTFMR